jgi:hypothetical protein
MGRPRGPLRVCVRLVPLLGDRRPLAPLAHHMERVRDDLQHVTAAGTYMICEELKVKKPIPLHKPGCTFIVL